MHLQLCVCACDLVACDNVNHREEPFAFIPLLGLARLTYPVLVAHVCVCVCVCDGSPSSSFFRWWCSAATSKATETAGRRLWRLGSSVSIRRHEALLFAQN